MARLTEAKKRIAADIKQYYPAVIIFAVYAAFFTFLFGNICPMVLITGFPCPGCGMTRAVLCLFTGRLGKSFVYNPTALLWLILILLYLTDRYFFRRITRKAKYAALIIAALITLGVYVYRMVFMFPGEPPLIYSERNLIHTIIQLIRN